MAEEKDFFNIDLEAQLVSFKEHLDEHELECFIREDERLDKVLSSMKLKMFEKYNKTVADRISQDVIIKEIQKELECPSEELTKRLVRMENKDLQQILSVLRLSQNLKKL